MQEEDGRRRLVTRDSRTQLPRAAQSVLKGTLILILHGLIRGKPATPLTHCGRNPPLSNGGFSMQPVSTPEQTVPVSTAGAVAHVVVKDGRHQIHGRLN